MLVLSRKVGERIVIDDRITITIQRVAGNRVSLGIEAPRDVHIARAELKPLEEVAAAETEAPARARQAAARIPGDEGFQSATRGAAESAGRVAAKARRKTLPR